MTLKGKVVDPDGRPVDRAPIYLAFGDLGYSFTAGYGQAQETPELKTQTNSVGEFQFQVDPLDITKQRGATIIAAAPSGAAWGVDWNWASSFKPVDPSLRDRASADPAIANKLAEMKTLRLVHDDVPIQGRLLHPDGRAAVGVRVRVANIQQVRDDDLAGYVAIAIEDGPINPYDDARNKFMTKTYYGESGRRNGFGDIISSTTDADGRFQLRGFGRNRVGWLLMDGGNIDVERVLVRSQQGDKLRMRDGGVFFDFYPADFELTRSVASSLTGTIIDQNTGEPIPGIVVQSVNSVWTGMFMAITNAQGRYRLAGIRPGEPLYLLSTAHSTPHLPSFQSVTPNARETQFDWKLKRGEWVEGQVLDPRTQTGVISEVYYFAFDDNPEAVDSPGYSGFLDYPGPRPFRTDRNGRFRIAALLGRGLVTVKSIFHDEDFLKNKGQADIVGHQNGNGMWKTFHTLPGPCRVAQFHGVQAVDVKAGEKNDALTFTLAPGKMLRARILDPDGKPLSRFVYSGRFERGFHMYANPESELKIYEYDPSFTRRIIVWHEEGKLAGTFILSGPQPEAIDLTLEPQGTLLGRVIDEQGKPIVGIDLVVPPLLDPDLPTTIGVLPRHGYRTDADGRFRIEGLAPGMKYNLVTQKQGEFMRVVVDAQLQSGQTLDLGDLNLRKFSRD